MSVSPKVALRAGFSQLFQKHYFPEKSAAIADLLKEIFDFSGANVAVFYPVAHEPHLLEYFRSLSAFAAVYLPVSGEDGRHYGLALIQDWSKDLVPGKYGILEPGPLCQRLENADQVISHWLVPGLYFDCFGNRMGRGKGVYDRLLADSVGVKIGLCFQWQILPAIQSESHDVAMDFVVTDWQVYESR